ADFWRFEVEDRVLPQPAISAIQDELDAFNAAAQDPDNYVRNDYLDGLDENNATVDPFTPCDPTALTGDARLNCVVNPETYRVENVVRAAQSTDGQLTTIYLSAINAGTIESDGVDFKASYQWDNNWGLFNIGLDYTHVRKYELNDVPGLELGLLETGGVDAAGTTGDGNLVRSLPDNTANIAFNWLHNSHSSNLTNHYIGSYEDLAYAATYQTSNDEVRAMISPEIDSYSTWDMQYSYRHAWANEALGTSIFTVGVNDMFNADIPYRETGSLNYDATVFDGQIGRSTCRQI